MILHPSVNTSYGPARRSHAGICRSFSRHDAAFTGTIRGVRPSCGHEWTVVNHGPLNYLGR